MVSSSIVFVPATCTAHTSFCSSKGLCLCCKSLCIFMLLFLSHPLPVLIFCSLNSLCREFRVRANSKGNFEVCSAFWKQLWVFMLWQRIKQRNKPPVLQYVCSRYVCLWCQCNTDWTVLLIFFKENSYFALGRSFLWHAYLVCGHW